MRLDTEDRELLVTWGIRWGVRATAAGIAVIGSAAILGTAWRVFEVIRG